MKTHKSLSHVVYSCNYHVVWCPKYRRKVLIEPVAKRLKELMDKKASDMGCKLVEVEVMPDHVHLLIESPPTESVGTIVGRLKGFTSKMLRQEFPQLKSKLPCLWTNSYFVSSTGGVPLEAIKKYIENQKNK